MTANKIYRVKDTGVPAPGFLYLPAVAGNYARYTRGTLTGITITHYGFTMRIRLDAAMPDSSSITGWSGSFTSFRVYTDRTISVACYSGGAIGAAKSNPIPTTIGVDLWIRGIVQTSDAVCSYWYSYDNVEDPALVTWIPIGTPTGSRPGLTPALSNSGIMYIGTTTNTASPLKGRIYYWQEEINGAVQAAADYHGLTLPPSTTVTGTAIESPARFHPKTSLVPEEFKDWYTGSTRAWPLREGQPLTVDTIPDIYKGDARLWPGADGCVEFPGVTGNVLSIPHRSDWDPPGSPTTMTIIAEIAPFTWADEGVNRPFLVHYFGGAGGGGFELRLRYGQFLCFVNDGTGSVGAFYTVSNTFDGSFVDGQPRWMALVMRANTAYWWVSYDRVNWTAFGTGAINSIAPAVTDLYVGANGLGGSTFKGRIFNLSLYNGANADGTPGGGTEVFRIDRDTFLGVGRRATVLSPKTIGPLALLPEVGVVTTPDPGYPGNDFVVRAKVRGPRSGGAQYIASQFPGSPNDSWAFIRYLPTQDVWLGLSDTPGQSTSMSSGGVVPITGLDDFIAMRVTVQPNALIGGYVSTDGVTWTHIYTSDWGARALPINDTAAELRLGARSTVSATPFPGRIYWVEVSTGTTDPNVPGTLLWRFDVAEYVSGTSFVDARGVTWTLSNANCIAQEFAPDPAMIVNKAGATPTMLYPTVSEMKARWGATQWNDGTKWSA